MRKSNIRKAHSKNLHRVNIFTQKRECNKSVDGKWARSRHTTDTTSWVCTASTAYSAKIASIKNDDELVRNAKISHNEFYTHSTGYRNTYARQSPYRFARTKSNKQRIFFAVLVILIHRLRNIYILSGNLPDKKTTTAR